MNIVELIKNNKVAAGLILLLIVVTLSTHFYGITDTGDYADAAKYFAGDYSANIRNSHSYMMGFIHSPFVGAMNNFLSFKITSLLFLGLIIFSTYRISNNNKKTFWLLLASPLVWYMAPWISPIQISTLCLLWAYHFINVYDVSNKVKHLAYAGLLMGLGLVFWDTILYLLIFMGVVYLYNKKASHIIYYLIFAGIGLAPRLLLDQVLFNFAFFTTIKTFLSGFVNLLYGGIYGKQSFVSKTFLNIIIILLTLPYYAWMLYKPDYIKHHKKQVLFLSLTLLLYFTNPQPRYFLSILPFLILMIVPEMTNKQYKTQLKLFAIVTLIVLIPYVIQISYNINDEVRGEDYRTLLTVSQKLELSTTFPSKEINEDLHNIAQNYPQETFVVGDRPDDYQILADIYWGEDIKELVSLHDYQLYLENEDELFHIHFFTDSNIDNRRQLWISAGMNKNPEDTTDYESIIYGLSHGDDLGVEGFEVEKEYKQLTLWKKITEQKQ